MKVFHIDSKDETDNTVDNAMGNGRKPFLTWGRCRCFPSSGIPRCKPSTSGPRRAGHWRSNESPENDWIGDIVLILVILVTLDLYWWYWWVTKSPISPIWWDQRYLWLRSSFATTTTGWFISRLQWWGMPSEKNGIKWKNLPPPCLNSLWTDMSQKIVAYFA